jgi:hypothetical protein
LWQAVAGALSLSITTRPGPDQLWGPPRLLSDGYRGSPQG